MAYTSGSEKKNIIYVKDTARRVKTEKQKYNSVCRGKRCKQTRQIFHHQSQYVWTRPSDWLLTKLVATGITYKVLLHLIDSRGSRVKGHRQCPCPINVGMMTGSSRQKVLLEDSFHLLAPCLLRPYQILFSGSRDAFV